MDGKLQIDASEAAPATPAKPTSTTTPTATPAKEEQKRTMAASAIATALHSTCFHPASGSPASTPLRTGGAAGGAAGGGFVAEPPDWSLVSAPSQQPPQQKFLTPRRHGSSSSEIAFPPAPFAPSASAGSGAPPSLGGSAGSRAASRDGSPGGGGSVGSGYSAGAAPFAGRAQPPAAAPPLSLSRSGDTVGSGKVGLSSSFGSGQMPQGQLQGQPQQGQQLQQGPGADASVLLGLEELERQQAEVEKRRANEAARKRQEEQQAKPTYSAGLPPLAPVPSGASQHREDEVPSQIHLTDEEETLTSEVTEKGLEMKKVNSVGKLRGQMTVSLRRFRSWSMTAAGDNPVGSVDSTQKDTLSRSSGAPVAPSAIQEPYLEDGEPKPIIYGYLHKLGRNGHWQKRFFETNGRSLTYYKNAKRNKVLATLDLCKVGEITKDQTDPEACTFTIQVSNRPYYLRAEDKTQCNDWVITLNRAREARMNVGNIQLVTPKPDDPHRSQAGSDEYTPHIVISALRPRTHGSDLPPDLLTCHTEEEQQQIEVMGNWDHFDNHRRDAAVRPASPKKSPFASPPMAKWQKKHSTMHQLSLRFLRWARSITKQADACRREKDVVVVPAHVLQAINQQNSTAAASAQPVAGGTSSARRKVSGSGSDLPVLAEEAPLPGRGEGPNRSRTSTESTAGGIGGSQYV